MLDSDAALLCYQSYYGPAYFDKVFDVGGVWVGYKLVDGVITLTCRGSLTWEDWWRDAKSIKPIQHPILGLVGDGFIDGVDEAFDTISKTLPLPQKTIIKLYGHSLGGAHAFYLAGLFLQRGFYVEVVAFEPPRSCGPDLCARLAKYPVRLYRNGEDEVTEFPLELAHPVPPEAVYCVPVTGILDPGRFHHIPLVICAMILKERCYAA